MADDDVQLTDLEVIQRYSLAVRGATASRAELVTALQADLAWLQGSRRSAPAPSKASLAKAPATVKAPAPSKASPAKAPAPAKAPPPARAVQKAPAKRPAKTVSTKRKA